MMAILDWVSEGTLVHQIFRIIAVVGFAMAVLQVILRLLGVGDHVDLPDGLDGDGDGGHAISWTTVAGFALGFGSVGSILLNANYSIPVAATGGAATGLAIGASFYFLMRAFSRLKEDNTFNIASTVGKIGTAYIRIPARQGGGQIQVVAQSRMVTLAALCDEEITSGEKVKVLAVIDSETVKVERVG
jgi:hypothetical protein